jgi:hypothetical protein
MQAPSNVSYNPQASDTLMGEFLQEYDRIDRLTSLPNTSEEASSSRIHALPHASYTSPNYFPPNGTSMMRAIPENQPHCQPVARLPPIQSTPVPPRSTNGSESINNPHRPSAIVNNPAIPQSTYEAEIFAIVESSRTLYQDLVKAVVSLRQPRRYLCESRTISPAIKIIDIGTIKRYLQDLVANKLPLLQSFKRKCKSYGYLRTDKSTDPN